MLEGIPKISVLIICYKQEELIKRAINSLLAQKDYIYEICVSDDCSPDGTWEVLQGYAKEYPGLFKLHQNNPNVGIFENIEYTWTMPTGDIIYRLAGDDECGDGWFKTVINYILSKKIDYKKELFCIYGDYVGIDPHGKIIYHRNDLVTSKNSLLSLSLRCIVGNRGACFSSKILKKFFKVSQGRSHVAESAIDRQLQLFSEKNYYIPVVGNKYYSGIGVSTNIACEKIYLERKRINSYMLERFAEHGYRPSKSDLRFFACDDAFISFLHQKSFTNGLKYFYYWILSYDFNIGIRSLNLNFLFSHIGNILKKKR